MPRHATHLIIVAVLFGAVSCAEPYIDQEPVYSVTGQVLFSGQPAAGAVVCFHPLDESPSNGLRSHAEVAADGTYSLSTYVKNDGAREGHYVVTIYWADARLTAPSEEEHDDDATELQPDRLRGRFANQQSSILRAAVGSQPTEFEPVDLESAELKRSAEYHLRQKS